MQVPGWSSIKNLAQTIPKNLWNSTVGIPMSSDQTAATLDKVDLSDFQAGQTFSAANVNILAAVSTLAYSDPKDQKKHVKLQDDVGHFRVLNSQDNAKLGIKAPDTGTQLSVIETEDALLVAARGTSPPWLANIGKENGMQWQDLVADIAALPVANYASNANVHGGFKQAADGIWGQLKPLLEQARASQKAIHFAGHSLGAAVALHLADRSQQELDLMPTSVSRFGGPDIGWGGQQKHLETSGLAERVTNFVNHNDPVPRVLPGGQSSGQTVYFDRRGQAIVSEDQHLWDRIWGGAVNVASGKINPIDDHIPVRYHERVSDPQNAQVWAQLEIRQNPA